MINSINGLSLCKKLKEAESSFFFLPQPCDLPHYDCLEWNKPLHHPFCRSETNSQIKEVTKQQKKITNPDVKESNCSWNYLWPVRRDNSNILWFDIQFKIAHRQTHKDLNEMLCAMLNIYSEHGPVLHMINTARSARNAKQVWEDLIWFQMQDVNPVLYLNLLKTKVIQHIFIKAILILM